MSREPEVGLYADPKLYDILYSPDTWREVDALERVEKTLTLSPLDKDRLWMEPACGSGRYLRCAARRGRRTAGYDLDPGMLRYAAARKLPASVLPTIYFTADMSDSLKPARRAGVQSETVDFAFNPVNSIRHLSSDRDLIRHLNQIAQLLKPGGIYVVGISLTDYDNLLPEEDVWTATRGGCQVSQLVNYLQPEPGTSADRFERVLSHLTVERAGRIEHYDHCYDLRTYDEAQWRDVVGASDLKWRGSFNALGRSTALAHPPYQLEALSR